MQEVLSGGCRVESQRWGACFASAPRFHLYYPKPRGRLTKNVPPYRPLGAATVRREKSRRGRERGACTAPQTRGVGPDSSTAPSIFPGPASAPEGVLPAGNCGPGNPPAPGWTGSAASRKLQVPGCPARVGHEGAAAGAAK